MRSPKRVSPKIGKWHQQIEVLEHQVMSLHHDRAMWRAIVDGLEEQADANRGVFLDHYTRMYVDASAIAVRRIASETTDDHAISLGRLLTDIGANCGLITQKQFVARYEEPNDTEEWRQRAARQQGEHDWMVLGGPGDALNAERVAEDLERLRSTAASVSGFADRTIAHIDKRGVKDQPTFAELDRAVGTLGVVLGRYSVLVRGSQLAFYEPAIQLDWRSPFRRPVFEPWG